MDSPLGPLPSLNALRVFEVVVRHLNFRLAGEELAVTQGAVAQQIRGLEAELGIKLFERRPRGLALSEAGRHYAASIRRAFELINQATEVLKPAPIHLTISVTPSFAAKWLIPRLADFSTRHPAIDLRIQATERLAGFQHDAVDLAVRYGRPPFGPGLQAELLAEEPVVAVVSPALLARLGPVSASTLSRYALLHDAHNRWPALLDLLAPQAGQALPRNLRFNQTALAIDAALAGQGIALASRLFVAEDLQAGRLVCALSQSLQPDAAFYLVQPRKAREQAPLTILRDWMLEQALPADRRA